MNSRDTLRQALDHQPGRLPVDFGGAPVTGIHVSVVAALREHFGLAAGPVRIHEPYQMLGEIDDDLRHALGIDTVGLPPRGTLFGYPMEAPWREWRCPWGQVVLVPRDFDPVVAPNGDLFVHPGNDKTVPASAHMPKQGFFFDAIVRQEAFDEDDLDPADNLEEFGPISDEDLADWDRRTAALRANGRAVVVNVGGTAFGDIALVPATFLKQPKGIRDISEWYMSLLTRRDYIHAVFARQCEIALANLARFHAVVGDRVDVLYVCGADFGTQISQFCSVETFDELFLPYYRQLNAWIHRHTTWKTFKHSCGAIFPLLPSLVKSGFDIINPVQCSATGMDPQRLKDTFGRDLVFWGGGVDTQRTLPFGTPAEVRAEVLERCRVFAPGGGFVFNTIHNTQAGTPVANFLAMIDAVREFQRAGG